MSAPAAGKRPLSFIAQEAEANGRTGKRRGSKRASFSSLSSSSSSFRRDETVFRILCPASKTGSIIGKAGSIIKSIRQDTGAMIRIEGAVLGCEERVVTISAKEEGFKPQKFKGPDSYGKVEEEEKVHYLTDTDEEEEDQAEDQEQAEGMAEGKKDDHEDAKGEALIEATNVGVEAKERGISPVQEALLRVHLRIVEADPAKPEENNEQEGELQISTRLLVPTSQVGCLLGKQGKIIAQMRQDSGAQIRVLARDQLLPCASPADEVVQITGDLIAVRKALLAASTQLRNNPPKKQSEEFGLAFSKVGGVLHSAEASALLAGNMMGANVSAGRPLSPRLAVGQSSDISLPHGKEDITFRILCPKEKIGSIIGKGGSIVQRVREETGAKISIDVSSDVGDERVVRVSAPEMPEDAFSKAQKAVMIIHSKILASDLDKDGLVTTKLLVPADQAGCLLGKGGSIMIEMRKLTRAKIHIHGKEHLPPCASETDELVEITGNFSVSQEALMQITARLRNNLFHAKFGPAYMDTKLLPFSGLASQNEGPLSLRTQRMPIAAPYERYRSPYSDSVAGFKGQQSLGTWPPQDIRGKVLTDFMGIGHTHAQREVAGDTRSHTTFIASQTVEVVVPEHTIGSIIGESGTNLNQICKISGARVKVHGLLPRASERIVEISGTPDQTHAAQSLLQAFILSGQ